MSTQGLSWISVLPRAWNALQLRRTLRGGSDGIKIGPFGSALRLSDLATSGARVYGQENVIAQDFDLGDRFIDGQKLRELSGYSVRCGDVLVTMMGTAGRCVAVPPHAPAGIMDSHLLRIRFRERQLDARFAVWLIGESSIIRDQFEVLGRGSIMHGLNSSIVKSVYVPLPPVPNQRAIADFLDRKTRAIDELIRKKERLIELLQQKRQALITLAVTRGLDPNVPMKDSGIEWIGQIPQHWHCKRLKQIASRVVVGIAQAATHAYADSGVPLVRSTNVRPNQISLEDLFYIEEGFANQLRSKYIHPGDLLTVRTGNAGVTAVVPPVLPLSQCFTMLITTLRPAHSPEFFSFQLNSDVGKVHFSLEGWGTAQANISVPILQNTPIVVPPGDEQLAILTWLKNKCGRLDAAAACIESQIDLLREYRQALISAAVIGQIDLTAEAAA